MAVEALGKGEPDKGICFKPTKQSVVILPIGRPGIFGPCRTVFSEMQNTCVGGGTPVYIVSMLICSPEAWICMAGWWSACVCVCLIQGFSLERMGKHWVFYSH